MSMSPISSMEHYVSSTSTNKVSSSRLYGGSISCRWATIFLILMELAEHFLSGAAALTVSYAVVHPLDTLRTQMQADGATALSALRANSLRTLMKGFAASVAGAAPQVADLDWSIL